MNYAIYSHNPQIHKVPMRKDKTIKTHKNLDFTLQGATSVEKAKVTMESTCK